MADQKNIHISYSDFLELSNKWLHDYDLKALDEIIMSQETKYTNYYYSKKYFHLGSYIKEITLCDTIYSGKPVKGCYFFEIENFKYKKYGRTEISQKFIVNQILNYNYMGVDSNNSSNLLKLKERLQPIQFDFNRITSRINLKNINNNYLIQLDNYKLHQYKNFNTLLKDKTFNSSLFNTERINSTIKKLSSIKKK